MSAPADVELPICKHVCMCQECHLQALDRGVDACPLCREPIEKSVASSSDRGRGTLYPAVVREFMQSLSIPDTTSVTRWLDDMYIQTHAK